MFDRNRDATGYTLGRDAHPSRYGARSRASFSTRSILLALLVLIIVPARAAGQQRLERLQISLWPEFDRPAMLVMLRAWLPAGTEYPASVRLPIPAEAGEPTAVAYRAPDGSMLVAPYELETEGETVWVVLTTDEPEVRLEYYVALDMSVPQRGYRFHWPAGTSVGQVFFDVLHPFGAADVTISPPGVRSRVRDNLIEERGDLGPLEETEEITVDVRYTKTSADLSATAPAAQPTVPETAPASGLDTGAEPEADSRWLILFVVATLTFLGGYALGRRGRSR